MSTQKPRKILMTTALPYANGVIHLGHLLEAFQADIWARFQKMCGHECLFLSGSDAHGTAIMIAAEKNAVPAEQFVEEVRKDHAIDFKNFFVEFDNFYTTHAPENEALVIDIFTKLNARGDITLKKITQSFDPKKQIFLADRLIKGTCPKCHAEDQYGDNCEVCSATYSPAELIHPRSALSGATPIEKESEHYFFHVEHYTDLLKEWINSEHLHPSVVNKLQEWFVDGLKPWDISRDAPYFGFKIPNSDNKYFYVWLDAPVGYMASLKNLIAKNDAFNFDDYWKKDSSTELHHFIGKDIMYFHALFWPAMLAGTGYRLPDKIHIHGYITINGEKMSKSRGTFITAKHYLEHLAPEYLRYYFAAKLNPTIEDIDLNLTDFMQRVNSDLVGKYINLASRTAGFITKKFDDQLADTLPDRALFDEFVAEGNSIAHGYETLNYSHAVRAIMGLADKANQYIDQHKPWAMAKDESKSADVQAVCTQGLNLFKLISTYLKPILPHIAHEVETFLNIEPMTWENRSKPLVHHTINAFKPMLQRITEEQIEKLRE